MKAHTDWNLPLPPSKGGIDRRFYFELAAPQDSPELLEILEGAGFKGKIGLLYTRRPDVYQSFQKEGRRVEVIVCRDRQQGRIVGFGAYAIRKLFVNGQAEEVGYLFGLRMRPEYFRKYPLLPGGYEFLRTRLDEQHIRLSLTTILTENHYVQKLLEKKRSFMPAYTPYGEYEIYALNTRKMAAGQSSGRRSSKSACTSLHFRPAAPADCAALAQFLNESGQNYQFFPVMTADDLRTGRISGVAITDFYLLCGAREEILAAGVAWDQRAYKQYLLQGYQGVLKLLWPFSRVLPFFGFPALPAPGSSLNFFTLSFWVVKDHQEQLGDIFLKQLAARFSGYPFFLVGIHASHPFRPMLQKCPHLSYQSKLYLVSWHESPEVLDNLEPTRVPYLECGML